MHRQVKESSRRLSIKAVFSILNLCVGSLKKQGKWPSFICTIIILTKMFKMMLKSTPVHRFGYVMEYFLPSVLVSIPLQE